MNQKKDCNCNDGIQKVLSNISDRYPYANDPSAALQNIDYKDWLVMSQGDGQNGMPQRMDAGTGISAGMAVVGTLLWGFTTTAAVGAAAAVVCAFSVIFPFLWPDKEEPKKVWEEFMKFGENIFGKIIQETERNRALTFIEGMKIELGKYDKALKNFQQNKNSKTASIVKREFNDAGDYIDTKLEELKLGGYQQILLPCYAYAAFLHLNLLQQGVALGDEWDKYSENYKNQGELGESSNYWYDLLIERIEKYIDYCTKTYKEGLDILKESPSKKWHIYNDYRREMTIGVLDLIALFPNYDVRKYPKGTKTELTREVYTVLSRPGIDRSNIPRIQFDKIEASLIRKPHLFTWFKGARYFTERTKRNNYLVDSLGGVVNLYSNTYNSSIWHDDKIQGPWDSETVIDDGIYVDKVSLERSIFSGDLDYEKDSYATEVKYDTFIEGTNSRDSLIVYKVGNKGVWYPLNDTMQIEQDVCNQTEQPCVPLGSHFLTAQSMYIDTFASARVYMHAFAWAHSSVDRRNTLAEDIITQIPAVKASAGRDVIKGPGHTGGDLVKIQNHTKIQMKCKVLKGKKYKIRIRYAANKEAELAMENYNNGKTTVKKLLKTYSGDDYTKYSSFQYIDLIEKILMHSDGMYFDFGLRSNINTSDTSILIDKIEFIPLEH